MSRTGIDEMTVTLTMKIAEEFWMQRNELNLSKYIFYAKDIKLISLIFLLRLDLI